MEVELPFCRNLIIPWELQKSMESRWLEVDVVPYNIALNAKESKAGDLENFRMDNPNQS